jgi:hypothetical protein
MTVYKENEMPKSIWIDKSFGKNPDDWTFYDGKFHDKDQLSKKVEYIRADLASIQTPELCKHSPDQTIQNPELLPCPFCGSNTVNDTNPPFHYCKDDDDFASMGTGTSYICPDCNTCGPIGRNDDECKKAWNTRVSQPVPVTETDKAAALRNLDILLDYAAPSLTKGTAERIAKTIRAALQQQDNGELVEVLEYCRENTYRIGAEVGNTRAESEVKRLCREQHEICETALAKHKKVQK